MLRCNAARRLNRNRIEPGNARVSSVIEQEKPFSVKRAALAATVGNMLEFYDFITYSFFAIQIGHTFFPTGSEYGSLMLSLATLRRRLRDAADRRNRARDLFRPDRPAACHAAELRAHGAIDP